jgi:hypothetical protein
MRRKGLTPLAGPGRMDGFHTGSTPEKWRRVRRLTQDTLLSG